MKPEIPKALFRKIKNAQDYVLGQRSRIVHAEQRIRETISEIEEFENGPDAYALCRYGRTHGVDSYPVVTRLSRLRADLDRSIDRRAVRAVALRDAESALAATEAETLRIVLGMSPSKGRVSWPEPVPAFIGYEEVTTINDVVLARAKDIDAAAKRGVELDRIHLQNKDAQARQDVPTSIERRRRSARPPGCIKSSRIVLANRISFTVTSPHDDGPEILQRAIDLDQAGPTVGGIWDLACAIFQSGVDWPGWETYHTRFRETFASQLRHQTCLTADPMISGTDALADYSLVDKVLGGISRQHYCPEGVRFPAFVAASPAKPSKLRAFVESVGLSKEQAEDWFLKTMSPGRLGRGRGRGYGSETLAAMEYVGLLSRGSSVGSADVIEALTYSELKAVMIDLGLKPERSIVRCRSSIIELLRGQHDRVRKALGDHGMEDVWVVHTPPGQSWAEFQSWRQQIRGMAEVITDLYFRKPMPEQDRQDLLM
jgi:hypothetical protein